MVRLFFLTGVLAFAMATQTMAAEQATPNILLILTDNTGWGDFGVYGGGALRGAPSPHIDQLAAQGLRLLNFNTEPQCTPSRAALMTGRHAIRCGTQSIPFGQPRYGLVPWEVTLAEALSERGYATGIFGKWHLGKTPGRFPTDQGFDEWYGIPNSSDESAWTWNEALRSNSILADAQIPEERLPSIFEGRKGAVPRRLKTFDIEERRRIDGELTRRTIDFMTRCKKTGKPFLAYAPLTAMHYPTLPHPDFAGKSGHGDYADMLVQTDAYVGQMLEALDTLGLAENTIVIFTADNGVEHPDIGDGNGWTGPWAGTYFTAMEGGLRVPFIVRWPGRVPAGRVSNEIVHLVDLFPTLAAVTGARVPADRAIDGIAMADFWTGKTEKSGREGFLIYVGNELQAIKWHDWKLHYVWQETKYGPVERFSTIPKVVDLVRDPRETRQAFYPYNTWVQYPTTELRRAFEESAKQYPHVPVGAPDDYRPEKAGQGT